MVRATYIPIGIQFYKKDYNFIWYLSDRGDGVLLEPEGIPLFRERRNLDAYAAMRHIPLSDADEQYPYNLDQLKQWLRGDKIEIDCKMGLAMWHLFSGIAGSLKLPFVGDQGEQIKDQIYDKLFLGTQEIPGSENYQPIWKKQEVKQLKSILKSGFRMFEHNSIITD